jgi:phage terminase large subunit GpA-like protein
MGRRESPTAVDRRRAGEISNGSIAVHARIQDVLGDTTTKEVYFAKSSQVAGSTVGENFIGYLMDRAPCAILMVWPTESKLKKWSLKRLDPMLMDTPVLKAKFPRTGRREPGDSIAYKDFPGGWLNAITAKSTTELKSDTARVAIAEEVDEWEYDLDAQGDPLDLLLVRLRTFFNRKLYVPSTPTIAGQSKIWTLLEESTWEEFWVPCPHCKEKQVLRWRDESPDGVEVGQYRFIFDRDEQATSSTARRSISASTARR